MTLNIKGIEAVLPVVKQLMELVNSYNSFHSIGYEKYPTKSGMVTIGIILQNMQAQGKDCFNYNEETFVQMFNEGVQLIDMFSKYMNWHFPLFINNELKCTIKGILCEEN